MTETAHDVLTRASVLIVERGRQRDMPTGERSMARAVTAFNALYGHALSEADGWAFMAVLKRARGRDADSLVDGVAYAALEAECAMSDIRRSPEDRG